jgi:hypothetical protein
VKDDTHGALVLPYLVDKTISQSTRISNIEIIIDETVDAPEEEPEVEECIIFTHTCSVC